MLRRTDGCTGGATRRANLLEIIAHAWLDQFERNRRILIRNYRQTVWEEHAIDGDADEEELILSGPHGFIQHGLRLSAANPHNSLLLRAALSLRMHVAAPESALRLESSSCITPRRNSKHGSERT